MKKIYCAVVSWSITSLLISTSSLAETGGEKNISGFQTPSGNIQCELVGEEQENLRCEIASLLNPIPPQPYQGFCEFDWGGGFLLAQTGKPNILCISDTIREPKKYVLPYGETWTSGEFKCISRKVGLTCTNSTGNGFFLSREKWRVL
ncbi:hypothetical protein FACHB389_34425 [Nostoc calcicola FACHB-389]|nr:hypothetical protein [Nostoc calcicola FACHB-3891]OKH17711.1 hypothetical protein FACHB389_34425 [Nostoc calcicola FACHB-389]